MSEEQSAKSASTMKAWSVLFGFLAGVVFCIFVLNATGQLKRKQHFSVKNATHEPVQLNNFTIPAGATGNYSLPDQTVLEANGVSLGLFTHKGRTAELAESESGQLVLQYTDE